ncbi:MAG: exonuclease domain-containing protein [Ruminiclostridium sp.]|nr:exonuclease domain-containing protein [Ruminiclostridium sp.]
MNYIIFDLEWNQPVNSGKSSEMPHGEIIQIGFVAVSEEMEITHREELMIKPVIYRVMNPYVSTLTGITQADIDRGMSLPEAMEIMSRYFGAETVLMTWGDDDMPILRENLSYHGIGSDMLPAHYNLQRIFAAQTESHLRQTGLKTALEILGITDEIKAHDALNDAYMTYLIAKKLDLAQGIGNYAGISEKTAVKRPLWETQKPVFVVRSVFSGNPSGMAAKCRGLHFCCPQCGKDFFGTEPVRLGKNSFIAAGECPDLGGLFFRFSLKEGYISAAGFRMNDELDGIYKARLSSREKREKRREMFRDAARMKRKSKKNDE